MVADASNKASPLMALAAGGIAGGVEAACTYPFEFAKTRVQLYGHEGVRNPFYVVAKVAREEGLRALYKGCSTMIVVCNTIRFVPVSGTWFLAFRCCVFSFRTVVPVYKLKRLPFLPCLPCFPGKCPAVVGEVYALESDRR